MGAAASSASSSALCEQDQGRVNQVLKWIVSGATEQDIREAIDKNWPGTEARPLIMAVMEGLQRSANFDPVVVVGWCFEATRDLYRRMVEIGDFAGALRAVKQLAEMSDRVPNRPEPAIEAEEKPIVHGDGLRSEEAPRDEPQR